MHREDIDFLKVIIAAIVLFIIVHLLTSCSLPLGSWHEPAQGALPASELSSPEPMYVSGMVRVGGEKVDVGTMIVAACGSSAFAVSQTFTYPNHEAADFSAYGMQINADNPHTDIRDGCVEGDTVTFGIGNTVARETIIWMSGVEIDLNLTGEPQPDDLSGY
jgi:hypothetical protein